MVDADKQAINQEMNATSHQSIRYFSAMALTAFVLNLIWEMAQMRTYMNFTGQHWTETIGRCTQAAAGDVLLTFAIYGVGALAARNWWWGAKEPINSYATGAILGFLFALTIEHVATGMGRWRYDDTMPVIAVLQAGLWPLLQLTLLVPLSWWVSNRFARG